MNSVLQIIVASGLEEGGISLFNAVFGLIKTWTPVATLSALAIGGLLCCLGEKNREKGKEVMKWACIGFVGVQAAASVVTWLQANAQF